MSLTEEYCQITKPKATNANSVYNVQYKGSIIQNHNGPFFLLGLTFACDALIACTKQLNIMDEESATGNYGTVLAHTANAIKMAIKENKISGTEPFIAFTQISHIIREMGDLKIKIYALFFEAAAKSLFEFKSNEHVTANVWLTALTFANKTIFNIDEALVTNRAMLNTLVAVEQKLRESLKSGLNPINAFGEAVKEAEDSAMKTVHTSSLHAVSSTEHKVLKYPDPEAHAVGIWMRSAYEGIKLKFGHEYV